MTQPTTASEPTAEADAATGPLVAVDRRLPGLHATAPQPLPFAPSISIRAFLLVREEGNVLIYSTGTLDSARQRIAELGGASRRYLNHGHEGMFLPESIDAPLFVHEADAESVASRTPVRATFSRRHRLDDDLEVIPTPGHTAGATAYLWATGNRRLLFTGDSIYLDRGEWTAGLLESSDRAAFLDSLELLRELDFDVLVPWAATAGEPYHSVTSRDEARGRIDAMIARLRAGGAG